jgi:triacylglycerol lipase
MVSTINLKYPLVLVHGAVFREKTLGVDYWSRIPRYLERAGVTVHFSNTGAWVTIKANGEILKKTILGILEKTGTEKVNIFAFSRGGLEARYMISCLDMGSRVASLTTMSSPHRGSRFVDILLGMFPWLFRFFAFFQNPWGRLLGDLNPDFLTSCRELGEAWCSEFNRECPDIKGVYYQSYATKLRFFFGDPVLFFSWLLLWLDDGPNDGICSVESAKWGNFRGVITTKGIFGVSHAGIADLYRIPYRGVRVPELYVSIVRELAGRGF